MKGQAFLALVILIGGIVILIGVTLAFLANSFIDTGYGYQALAQAEAVATSGAEDGLLQLARNYNFSNTSGYSLAVGSSTARVTVTQSSTPPTYATILSIATVANRTRKVNVYVVVNASTSQVTVLSWKDVQ